MNISFQQKLLALNFTYELKRNMFAEHIDSVIFLVKRALNAN